MSWLARVSQTFMDRSQTDPKLGEVRAVLQRLQTFSAQPSNTPLQSETSRALESGALESSASESVAKNRTPAVTVATIAAAAVMLLGLAWFTVSPADRAYLPTAGTQDAAPQGRATRENDVTVGGPALRSSAPRAAMDIVHNLLSRGQVQAARKQLLGLAPEGATDVAWMLARSYDPNFLAAIPDADAGPDIEQATRWYRTWHAAAVRQGLVPNSVSVERIIGSMR